MEWLNVSAVEASPDWAYVGDAIVDDGSAWVGLSVQALGVVGGASLIDTGSDQQDAFGGGIRANNPERYGSLEHPGDAYALDIYSQVGAALRAPAGSPVLGGAEVTRVIAAGESQSAGFLTTYVNAIQPEADVFDGFFVHSRGSGTAQLDGTPGIRGSEIAYRFRDDLDVPVLVFETETDVGPLLAYATARQPDTDHLRIWEVTGTAHADAYLVGSELHLLLAPDQRRAPALGGQGGDGGPPRVGRRRRGALARRAHQHRGARAAPRSSATSTAWPLGGIRTPSVDVPVSALSGEAPDGEEILCRLFGSSIPFDAATLASLYPTTDDYLEQFDAALDVAIAAGFVRASDRDAYAAEARAVPLTR